MLANERQMPSAVTAGWLSAIVPVASPYLIALPHCPNGGNRC